MWLWRTYPAWQLEQEYERDPDVDPGNVVYSPDSAFVAYDSGDHLDVRWADGRLAMHYSGRLSHGFVTNDLIALDSYDDHRFHCYELWDVRTNSLAQTVNAKDFAHCEIHVSPNRKYVMVSDDRFMLLDVKTGKQVVNFKALGNTMGGVHSGDLEEMKRRVQSEFLAGVLEADDLLEFYERTKISMYVGHKEDEFRQPIGDPDYYCAFRVAGGTTADGSRLFTHVEGTNVLQIWDSSTLKKLGTKTVEYNLSLFRVSPSGRYALFKNDKDLYFLDLQYSHPVPLSPLIIKKYSEDEMGFMGDRDVVKKTFKERTSPTLLFDLDTQQLLENVPSNPVFSPDLSLQAGFSDDTLCVHATQEPLFNFNASIRAIAPDNRHIATESPGKVTLWQRARPEQWWGIFYLPATYALLLFSLALIVSVFRGRR